MRKTGLLASLVLAASSFGATAQDIQIGFIAPLTGPAAAYGRDLLNGAALAVEDINAAGGVGGRKVKLVEGDDRGSPKDAANVAQSFVSDANILAMIGGATSTATFGATPVAQRGKLPFMITLASHPDLTKQGDQIFRNSATQELEGPAIGKLVARCLGAKSVGIVHLNNDWALAMTREFKKSLAELGIKVTAEESYDPGENVDYTAKLIKVRATNPDIIWLGSQYDDLALVLRQAQRIDLGKRPLVGSSGVHSTGLTSVAGAAANGLYLHTLFFSDSSDEKVKAFTSRFQAKYKQDPNLFSSQAYDGVFMLANAAVSGGFTREGLRQALIDMEPYAGVGGSISFDPATREARGKSFTPLVIKDQKFTVWDECRAKLAK